MSFTKLIITNCVLSRPPRELVLFKTSWFLEPSALQHFHLWGPAPSSPAWVPPSSRRTGRMWRWARTAIANWRLTHLQPAEIRNYLLGWTHSTRHQVKFYIWRTLKIDDQTCNDFWRDYLLMLWSNNGGWSWVYIWRISYLTSFSTIIFTLFYNNIPLLRWLGMFLVTLPITADTVPSCCEVSDW